MAMLINDNETLKKYVPNTLKAVAGELSLFDKIQYHLLQAEQWLTDTFVSSDTMSRIRTYSDSTPLLHYCRIITAAEAMLHAVPQLDLILTPNEFFSPELMDMLRTANALNKWDMTLDTAQYKRMYQRISVIEFSILRISEYPIPSIIDIVNSIRLAKGNVFAEWKNSKTAKLFEDHGYKNKKESSGDVTPKSCIFM